MTLFSLPEVTLVCADCVDADRAIVVLEKCRAQIAFGATKLLTSIATDYAYAQQIRPLKSLNDYSAFCLKDLFKYVTTSHMLIVQHDGWIINPGSWNATWASLDYIGPLFLQEREVNAESVGSGGFSLRSTRLMRRVANMLPPWDGCMSYDGGTTNNWAHEDGVIAKHLRKRLEGEGFRFGTPEQARDFAYGGNPTMRSETAFGFHGFWDELAWQGADAKAVQEGIVRLKQERACDELTRETQDMGGYDPKGAA